MTESDRKHLEHIKSYGYELGTDKDWLIQLVERMDTVLARCTCTSTLSEMRDFFNERDV